MMGMHQSPARPSSWIRTHPSVLTLLILCTGCALIVQDVAAYAALISTVIASILLWRGGYRLWRSSSELESARKQSAATIGFAVVVGIVLQFVPTVHWSYIWLGAVLVAGLVHAVQFLEVGK